MTFEASFVRGSVSTSTCLQKIIESKWTDVILITCIVTLLIIGILASLEVFNSIGTINSTYLSYGMYVGAFMFFILELTKIVILRKTQKTNAPMLNAISFPEKIKNLKPLQTCIGDSPLTQEEISNWKQQAVTYSSTHYKIHIPPANSDLDDTEWVIFPEPSKEVIMTAK